MSDYIKREDAIKTLEGWKISGEMILATVPSADVVERSSYESMEHTVAKLNEALSNSVEIVRCKDCKYAEVADPEDSQDGYTCQFHRGSIWFSGSYCSWAERRTDG